MPLAHVSACNLTCSIYSPPIEKRRLPASLHLRLVSFGIFSTRSLPLHSIYTHLVPISRWGSNEVESGAQCYIGPLYKLLIHFTLEI